MNQIKLQEILDKLRGVHVAVIGDCCLDIYWHADMTLSELSRETPHFPLPITEERQLLGAGSNVAANVAALGARRVDVLTVIGDDWRAREWLQIADDAGISNEFVIQDKGRVTPAYCKPMRKGVSDVVYEDPRIDFNNRRAMSSTVEELVISKLQALSAQADAFIVSDQFVHGVLTPRVREAVCELAKRRLVFVDSRDNIAAYHDVIVKPNELELLTAVYRDQLQNQTDDKQILSAAQTLCRKVMGPVCVTLGDKGVLWVDEEQVRTYPAIQVAGPTDIVGAGDAFMAAMATTFATGSSQPDAVTMGTMAASIAIQKIGMAGVVARQELLDLTARDVTLSTRNGVS